MARAGAHFGRGKRQTAALALPVHGAGSAIGEIVVAGIDQARIVRRQAVEGHCHGVLAGQGGFRFRVVQVEERVAKPDVFR